MSRGYGSLERQKHPRPSVTSVIVLLLLFRPGRNAWPRDPRRVPQLPRLSALRSIAASLERPPSLNALATGGTSAPHLLRAGLGHDDSEFVGVARRRADGAGRDREAGRRFDRD